MRILIINGSHRNGNTDIVVEKVKKLLEKNHQIRVLVLREIEMKLPDGCENCANTEICPNIKDAFSENIEPTIRDYDVYVVASPTYSDSITPLTKIFWDRIVSWCDEERMYLKGKKLALITHGMEDIKHLDSNVTWLKGVCRWEEAIYGGALVFNSSNVVGKMNLKDSQIESFVQNLLK
jgi:multimeric flavodoxin WrbA